METVRESWTDERLDDFKERVDQRFDEVDRRFDEVDARFERIEAKMDTGFARMDARLDSMGRAIIFAAIAFPSSMIAGFVAIATQV
jgi:flagellar capping protein FliD